MAAAFCLLTAGVFSFLATVMLSAIGQAALVVCAIYSVVAAGANALNAVSCVVVDNTNAYVLNRLTGIVVDRSFIQALGESGGRLPLLEAVIRGDRSCRTFALYCIDGSCIQPLALRWMSPVQKPFILATQSAFEGRKKAERLAVSLGMRWNGEQYVMAESAGGNPDK
jgi:hypothetical protein